MRLLACLSTLISASAFAQSAQVPAPAQSKPIAILNATVHPVSGPTIEHGYVLFDKGLITGVGDARVIRLSSEVEMIDGAGMHVYPGFISAWTQLGLVETLQVPATDDRTEFGTVHPEVRACVSVNPDSDLIPVARAAGVLTAFVAPTGGVVSGRPSLMRLDGWTWEDMFIAEAGGSGGIIVNWPLTEPVQAEWNPIPEEQQRKEIRENLERIEKVFDEALAYIGSRDAHPDQPVDLRYEAMREVLPIGKSAAKTSATAPDNGAARIQKPVFITAANASQIESAVAWAVRRKLKPVIVGGFEADKVSSLLKQHSVPVIVNGLLRIPSKRQDPYDDAYTLPKRLLEAGVKFCIAGGQEPAHERNLAHNAGMAVAFGLTPEEGMKSITIWAAEVLGAEKMLGTIEAGKAATIMVTSGDPLDIRNDVLVAFIDGRKIDLGTRQKRLNEKYREKYRQLNLIKPRA